MKKNDAIGLGVSLIVHALALVLLAFVVTAAQKPEEEKPEEPPFIEVEFGLEEMGRAARTAAPVAQPAPKVVRPPVKKVELPKQQPVKAPEKVRSPQTDRIAPEEKPTPAPPKEEAPQTPAEPAEQGSPGTADSGPATGGGAGTDGAASGAFDMTGLESRDLLRYSLPRNVDNTRSVFRLRITVAPDGSVIGVQVLQKGNSPGNESASREALRRWRFNALPANAPRVNQQGTITFRFTLD